MARYEIEDRKGGFVVRGRAHPLDKPGWSAEVQFTKVRRE